MRRLTRFACVSAALLLLGCGARSRAQNVDVNKPALRYTFEDGPTNGNTTFTDTTGNGYNGTFTGAGDLTLGFSTDAEQGTYAGSTDGDAGRFAQVSSAKPFDFTSQFTVFTFLKMVDRGGQIQSIIGNAGGYPEDGFKFFINSYNTDDHKIFFEYEGAQIVTAPTNLLDGKYHAVAFSVDQVNSVVKIYLDGTPIANGTLTTPFPTANATINLGTDGFFTSTSKFDDFRVYNGILTDAQVANLSGLSAAPAAPTQLAGLAGNGVATLTWKGVSGATYNVKRGATSGGPYTTIATGVVPAAYSDAGLTNGTAYYYVVTAANAFGESASSNQAVVTPTAAPFLAVHYTFEDGPANGNATFTDTTGDGFSGVFYGGGDLTQGFSTDAEQGTYAGSTDASVGRFAQAASTRIYDFTSQFTVFTYLKMAENGSQIQSIIGNAPGYPEAGFKFFINSYGTDDHKLFFEYEGVQITTDPTNLLDGNYHAVAFSVDQVNSVVKIYLDGAVLVNTALSVPFPTANPTISLGTDGFFTSTSKFDDFQIYRGILTDAQVAALSVPGATVTGSIALEGVPNLAAIAPAAPLGVFDIQFRTPGTSTIILENKNVTLTASAGSAKGAYSVSGIPAGTYDVWIKGGKNLAVLVPNVIVSAAGGTVANVILPAADGNNDNSVDTSDFGVLVGGYNGDSTIPGSGYDPNADFNFDGVVDTSDFSLLVGQYNNVGAN